MGLGISYPAGVPTGLIYIDHDTEHSIDTSIVETTVGTCTIAPNIVQNRIIIRASILMDDNVGLNARTCTFKLKTGTAGAEVLRQTIQLNAGSATSCAIGGMMQYVEDTLNFALPQSVIITCKNSNNDATLTGYCMSLEVEGN